MKMLFAQSSETQLGTEHGKPQPGNPDLHLSFTISVNADRRRVFHVLTIAEYMETWLSVPGRHQLSPINVKSDADGFHVQYFDEDGTLTALIGSYHTFRTAKTQFFWRKIGASESDQSFVKIRLNGDFERTTLCLTHNGFSTDRERRWHAQLWDGSLKKLSSLFELQ